jgi:pentatricopeptide repeat domain-containing protein 2
MDLWKELKEIGHIPMRRAVTFAAAMALNQNAPHIAFEIISGIQQHNYVTVRNLKVHVIVNIYVLYFPNQYKFKMFEV